MKKRNVLKVCAIVLVSLLVVGMVAPALVYTFASDEEPQTQAQEQKRIPLLVIIMNFDANGNGKNDFDSEKSDRLFADMKSAEFGEQWAKTTPEYWNNIVFGSGTGSVADYFDEMSCGRIKYVPAAIENKEEAGTSIDGVISVNIKGKHPSAYKLSNPAMYRIYRIRMVDDAISAALKYMDLSSFDKDGDKKVSSSELSIVVINPGCDEANVTSEMQLPDDIHFTSVSELCSRKFNYSTIALDPGDKNNVASISEYTSPDITASVGDIAYMLMRIMGASDIGNNNSDGGKTAPVAGWPLAYNLSLLCDGYKLNGGRTPSYADPYSRIKAGISQETEIGGDGEYTLYSTKSGKYNILRIPTIDSDEYFLVELRSKEGFDEYVSSGVSGGGMMVWHIDEGINASYYKDGGACTSVSKDEKKHDPGIVPLVRTGWNVLGNRLETVSADDPFYYISGEKSTSVFNSSNFSGADSESISLNSYPAGWDRKKGYNVSIEILSETEDSVRIKIIRTDYTYLPMLTAKCLSFGKNSVTIEGNIFREFGEEIESCGIIVSKEVNPTEENGKLLSAVMSKNGNFYAVFDELESGTKYYFKAFAKTKSGTGYSEVGSAMTELSGEYYVCRMYRNITAGEEPIEIKCLLGSQIAYSFEMKKEGYRFVGWFTDAELTKQFDMSTVITDAGANITLYAKWEKEAETTQTTSPSQTTTTTATATATVTVPPQTTTPSTPAQTTTSTSPVQTTTTASEPLQTTTTPASTASVTTTGKPSVPSDSGNKNTLIIALCVVVIVLCAAFITALGFMRAKKK